MALLETLKNIEAEMDEILGRFKHTRDGVWIASGDQAAFMGLVLEAEELLNEAFGIANSFSLSMRTISSNGRMTFSGSQSFNSVEQTLGVLRSAIRKVMRGTVAKVRSVDDRAAVALYVSGSRLNELRAIKSESFDFRRLVRMCEELNASFAAENFIAAAALLRHQRPRSTRPWRRDLLSLCGPTERAFPQGLDGAAGAISKAHI